MADKEKIYRSDLPVQDKAAFLIICTAQELLNKIGRMTKEFGISLTQLQILHILEAMSQEKVTVNTIKAFMFDDSPNVSRSINKLVEKQLVTKQRSSEDQRVVFVSITPAGLKVHKACDHKIIGKTIDLPDKTCQALADLLMKL
ncbi:MAG: winged helix DNA-binding protein [Desulfatitalea sp.]|nr:winged helix DNA-binding protein [Desulfatitalea sp.]